MDNRNMLDKVIEFFNPERAYKRTLFRYALDDDRSNYDAGSFGRVSNNWRVYNQSGEMTDRMDRDTVRARARDLERNSDMMNAVLSAFKRNVYGSGFTLQARTANEGLNKEIEKAWQIWCKKENCDITGRQSFNQLMRMAVKRKKVDGGLLFLKVYTRDGLIPFKIQAIEVDDLDTGRTQPHHEGSDYRVIGGIEYNKYSKPVGYWFKQPSIDGYSYNDSIYYPAKYVIYYLTLNRPTQVREMSDMAPTITRVRDSNEFMNAVSVKERIAACLSVFIKKQTSVPGYAAGRNNANENRQSYDGKTLSPGMIKELNAGDDIQVVNPTGHATDAAQLIKLFQRLIGSGQGLSYEATSRDMSETNYASARQGMIEDGETYAEEVELLMELMDEIYETFLISGVLCGLFKIPGFWDNKYEYLAHGWIKAPKPWIDPSKEATANKIALETGQKTYKEICAENGRDWRSQIDDTVEVLTYAKAKGLEMGGVIFGQSVQTADESAPQDGSGNNDQSGGEEGTEGTEGSGDE